MLNQIKLSIGIQARSTSTRFPNKVTQMIGNKMVIDRMLETCKGCADYINRYTFTNRITAQTYLLIPKGDPLKDIMSHMTDTIIEGDESDVLSRYVQLAKQTGSDYIARITSDCPMLPQFLIFKCVNAAIKNNFDYFSNVGDVDGLLRTAPDGHDVEVMSLKALEWADKNAQSPKHREHVTWVLRDDNLPYFLKRGILMGWDDMSDVKLSLDTPADLEILQKKHEKLESKLAMARKKYGKSAIHRY